MKTLAIEHHRIVITYVVRKGLMVRADDVLRACSQEEGPATREEYELLKRPGQIPERCQRHKLLFPKVRHPRNPSWLLSLEWKDGSWEECWLTTEGNVALIGSEHSIVQIVRS